MIRTSFICFALAFTSTAYAHDSIFKFSPSAVFSYGCTSNNMANCSHQVINPGKVEVQVVNGAGNWEENFQANGFYFNIHVIVGGEPGDYDVWSFVHASYVDSTGKIISVLGHVNVTTSSGATLNRISTASEFLERNGEFAHAWMNIEGSQSLVRSEQNLLQLMGKDAAFRTLK